MLEDFEPSHESANNQTSIGFGAICNANNQVTLGNSSVTKLRCAVSTTATLSDQRDKTNITDLSYGLNFIDSVRPVEFEWNLRNLDFGDENNAKNGTRQVGFIAQGITICHDRKRK